MSVAHSHYRLLKTLSEYHRNSAYAVQTQQCCPSWVVLPVSLWHCCWVRSHWLQVTPGLLCINVGAQGLCMNLEPHRHPPTLLPWYQGCLPSTPSCGWEQLTALCWSSEVMPQSCSSAPITAELNITQHCEIQSDKLLLTEPAGEAGFAVCFLHQPLLNRAGHVLKLFHHPGFVTSHWIISKLKTDKHNHRHTPHWDSEPWSVVQKERQNPYWRQEQGNNRKACQSTGHKKQSMVRGLLQAVHRTLRSQHHLRKSNSAPHHPLPLWPPSWGLTALVHKQGFGGRKRGLSKMHWKKYMSQLPGNAVVFCTQVTASNQIFKH